MSARVLDTLLPRLRHEPTRKRVRATLAGELVIDIQAGTRPVRIELDGVLLAESARA